MILVVKGFIASRVYRKSSIDILNTFFYFDVLFLAVFIWYSLERLDSNWEAAAYISVTISLVVLVVIVIYHVYTYTYSTIFSKFKDW